MDPASRPNFFPSRLDRALTVLLLTGAVFYAIFLYREGSPYAGGSDSSGYLHSARLLAEGRFFAKMRVPTGLSPAAFGPETFQPLGFSAGHGDGRMAPTYPLGLPLHLLAAAKMGGWDRAPLIVNIFSALAGGGLLWLLARHFGFSPAWGAVAVAWLWLCPQFLFCALQPISDSLALLWSLAVLYTAFRSRESAGWAIGCGASLAMAVLVRPTNAMLLIPVLVATGFRPVTLLWMLLGGIPGAGLLGYYNHHVYGAVLTTGYGDIGAVFGSRNIPHNLSHMAGWIPRVLSPLIGAALLLPFFPEYRKRDVAVVALWTFLLIGFYAFYFHTGEHWWYLRFILPAYPLLILGAIATIRKIPARSTAMQATVLALTLAICLGCEIHFNQRLHPTSVKTEEQSYWQSAVWARENLPADSAIFCMQVSGAFYFYTDFLLVRWERIEPKYLSPLLATLQAQHRAVYAVLYEFEDAQARAELGGQWKKITTVGAATVWQRKD